MASKSSSIPPPSRKLSSTPHDSLAKSQQSHINELVDKTRTLEHLNVKLKNELDREKARSQQAMQDIKSKETEYEIELYRLHFCHKIEHHGTIIELERERRNTLNEQELLRKEKLARVERDFRITTFQIQEIKLENRIDELEDAIAKLEDGKDSKISELKVRYAEHAAETTVKSEHLQELQELQADNKALKTELEGALTTQAEIQRACDEFKQANNELKRRLDKWESLDKKDEQEVVNLRNKSVDLRVQIKKHEERATELQVEIKAMNASNEELQRKYDKEQARLKKLRETTQQWIEAHNTLSLEYTTLEEEKVELSEQLSRKDGMISKLRAKLENIRRGSYSTTTGEPETHDVDEEIADEEDADEDEVFQEIARTPSPSKTQRAKAKKPSSHAEAPKPKPKSTSATSGNDPGSKKRKRNERAEDDEEVQEPKSKKRTGKTKADAVTVDDDEDEHVEGSKQVAKKANAKTKDDESAEPPKKSAKKSTVKQTTASKAQPTKRATSQRTKSKGKDRATPPTPDQDDDEEVQEIPAMKTKSSAPTITGKSQPDIGEQDASDDVPKKKMRKIGGFPTASGSQTFNFSAMNLGGAGDALNSLIPTDLSPIKESQPIPARISSMATFRNMLSASMTRKG